MNEFWNLDPIYKGFDDPAFEADMAALRQCVTEYNACAATLDTLSPLEGLRAGIAWDEKLSQLVMKLAGYASLRQSTNTRDAEAGSRLGQIMQLLSATAGAQTTWKQWATALPNMMELIKADIVKVISKYMKIDTANMDIQISKSTPALYANIPILDLNQQ